MPGIVYYMDGGCLNNQSAFDRHAYGSYVMCVDTGSGLPAKVGVQTSVSMPERSTNNEAEYNTLLAVLAEIWDNYYPNGKYMNGALRAKMDCPHVTIFTDSQLVVYQSSGQWKIKEARLLPLCMRVRTYLAQMPEIKLVWIPRNQIVAMLGH